MTTKPQTTIPTWADILESLRYGIFSDLNCHEVGILEEIDYNTQLASVRIAHQRVVENMPSTSGRVDYPVLKGVPLMVLGGGDGSLRFPFKVGDSCLLFFNDKDLDNWAVTGSIGPLASDRKHSFSDAVALVGLRSLANPLADYSPERTELTHASTVISLGDKVRIENATKSLFTVLDSLVDIVGTLSSGVGVAPGNPIYPGLSAQVLALKAELAQLLE